MIRKIAAVLFVGVLGLLAVTPALARHQRRAHHIPPRARAHRLLRPRAVSSEMSGYVTVVAAPAGGLSVYGLPFDDLLVPVTVVSRRPLHVDDTQGTIWAAAALCTSRGGCTNVAAGNAYNTAPSSFIKAGDKLLLELNADAGTVSSAARSTSVVPTALIYDFGPG